MDIRVLPGLCIKTCPATVSTPLDFCKDVSCGLDLIDWSMVIFACRGRYVCRTRSIRAFFLMNSKGLFIRACIRGYRLGQYPSAYPSMTQPTRFFGILGQYPSAYPSMTQPSRYWYADSGYPPESVKTVTNTRPKRFRVQYKVPVRDVVGLGSRCRKFEKRERRRSYQLSPGMH